MSAKTLSGRLALTAALHPRAVLGAAGVLALALLLFLPRLQLRTSNLDLIDSQLPEVARFLDFSRHFGNPNPLILVVEGGGLEARIGLVNALAARLRAIAGVRGVMERIPLSKELAEEAGLPEYLTSFDEAQFFIFIQPRETRGDITQLQPMMTAVKQEVGLVLAQPSLAEGLSVGFTGIPQYAFDDRDFISRDMMRFSLVALVVILLLFRFGFAGLRVPLLAVVALLFGVLLTLGVVLIVYGYLTLVSALFASMLFGLGIDAGIHLAFHYERERLTAPSAAQAVVSAVDQLHGALLGAVFTSAGAFYLLFFCGFKGFSELGVIAGSGLILCLLSMITLFPALLVCFGGDPSLLPPHHRKLERLFLVGQHVPVGLVLLALGFLVLVTGMPTFDDDYRALQPKGSEALRLENLMTEGSDFSPYYAAFVVPDRQAAEQRADQLRALESVGAVRSLTDLDYLGDEGADAPEVPAAYRRLFVNEEGAYAVFAYPAESIWEPEAKARFLADMRRIDAGVTGMPFLGAFMMEQAFRGLMIAGSLSLVYLLILTTLTLKRPLLVILVFIPPLWAAAVSMVIMNLLGMKLNPLNIMAIPIVFGIAVDDALYLIHRVLLLGGRWRAALRQAGPAMLLTSLTTLAAFGSVAFSSHRGLRSFCLTLCLGVCSAFVVTVWGVPTLLRRIPGSGNAGPKRNLA